MATSERRSFPSKVALLLIVFKSMNQTSSTSTEYSQYETDDSDHSFTASKIDDEWDKLYVNCSPNNNCDCSVEAERVSCPSINPQIVIDVERYSLHINCYDADEHIYETMPGMHFKSYASYRVTFSDCPLPTHFIDVITKIRSIDDIWKLELTNLKYFGPNQVYERRHFNNITPLKEIVIVHDELTDWLLSVDLFDELLNLTEVYLRINGVQCPSKIFQNLQHLEIVEMKFAQFENGPIFQLLRTNELVINNCRFQNAMQPYERRHFANFTKLRKLTIIHDDDSVSTQLPGDLFDEMPNLEEMNVRLNGALFPTKIFQNLTFLKRLEIRLKIFDDGLLFVHPRLDDLTIVNCRFINESFANGTKIIRLRIEDSKFEVIQWNLFASLAQLAYVTFIGNGLISLSDNLFVNNRKFGTIFMQESQLKSISNELFANKSELGLVQLNCLLDSIPNDLFRNSTRIEFMEIIFSQLTTMPVDLFSDQFQLLRLILSNNLIDDLPIGIFDHLPVLNLLSLSNNRLTNISMDLFSELFQLRLLYLDNNRLHSITSRLHSLTTLTDLYLGNNSLSTGALEDVLIQLSSIETIYLQNNSITDITPMWKQISTRHLRLINLSYNKITRNDVFNNFPNCDGCLIGVDLGHNLISHVNYSIITAIDRLRINLAGNPIVCDCHFTIFIKNKFLLSSKIDIEDWSCAAPQSMEQRRVDNIQPEELICYLDSRADDCPDGCECSANSHKQLLVVNCSHSGRTELTKIPLISPYGNAFIELHLENNQMTQLPTFALPQYENVVKINAANNSIAVITSDNLPAGLISIDLSNNQLRTIDGDVIFKLNSSTVLRAISLSANPWECGDCNIANLFYYLTNRNGTVMDMDRIECANHEIGRLVDINIYEICLSNQMTYIEISLAVVGLLFVILIVIYFKYVETIKVWLLAHNLCLCLITEDDLDENKWHDAFISYAHQDEDFVRDRLVSELESGNDPFKLCLHYRDWLAGEAVTRQISESVERSRRTIIVLSSHFIQSIWGRMELRVAHSKAMTEGRSRVIVVVYGDIGDIKLLDPELKAYLTSRVYLKWGEEHFYDKLRMALPRRSPCKLKERVKNIRRMGSLADIELSER